MADNPGALVEQAVERSLLLIKTWPAWDGQPLTSDDGRIYTPHKAVRRIADHIVDHLAEIEALLASVPTQPDEWHASELTSEADLAPFTVEDVQEAEQRLRRLGRTFALRYAAVDPIEWGKDRGENRTLRETAEHLAESEWYAEQVGDLS
jgi:glutamine synthetase adenylyltransferase